MRKRVGTSAEALNLCPARAEDAETGTEARRIFIFI